QFQRGQDLQRQVNAVDLFVKYHEQVLEKASGGAPSDVRENLGLALAEAIYLATSPDHGWTKTVEWMLSHHTAFITTEVDADSGETFNKGFRELLNKAAGRQVCQ